MTSQKPNLLAVAATVVGVLIAGYWGGRVAVAENHHEDLWIYSSGSWFALHGQSPYDTEAMHARVAERWPDDPNLDGNNGFFLTPQALLVFAPFAAVPWAVAKAVWCAGMVALAAGIGWKVRVFASGPLPGWFTAAAVTAALLNPLTTFVLVVGQTPLMILGAIVFGEVAHRKGWKRLGCLLWALAFIKPHIALPLIPLAWYLGGWRRAAEVAAWAGGLNVLAGLAFFGKPLYLLDYLAGVQQGHQTVEFNRVAVNRQISGWNRLVRACGGPAIELGLVGTLAGHAVWLALVAARGRLSATLSPGAAERAPSEGEGGPRSGPGEGFSERPLTPSPSPSDGARSRGTWGEGSKKAWVVACVGCGMLACCQLLPYELPLMLLALPHVGELAASGRKRDKLAAGVIMLFVAYAFLDGGQNSAVEQCVRGVCGPVDAWLTDVFHRTISTTDVFLSHRCVGVLGVSFATLAFGPAKGRPLTITSSDSACPP